MQDWLFKRGLAILLVVSLRVTGASAEWVYLQMPYAYSVNDRGWYYLSISSLPAYNLQTHQSVNTPDGWLWIQTPYLYSMPIQGWLYTLVSGLWVYEFNTHKWVWIEANATSAAGTWTRPNFTVWQMSLNASGSITGWFDEDSPIQNGYWTQNGATVEVHLESISHFASYVLTVYTTGNLTLASDGTRLTGTLTVRNDAEPDRSSVSETPRYWDAVFTK